MVLQKGDVNMQFVIRDFKVSDREIYYMMSEKFYHSDAVSHPVPKEFFIKTFNMCIEKSPFTRGLLIEQDHLAAGFALLAFTYSNEVGGLVLLIEDLFILPEFRGRGLVRHFFDYLENEYHGKVRRYRLEVTKNNHQAIGIYQHLGYEKMAYISMVKEV
jgi:ribosomal protein S18 acetylase RimI-like enzyme